MPPVVGFWPFFLSPLHITGRSLDIEALCHIFIMGFQTAKTQRVAEFDQDQAKYTLAVRESLICIKCSSRLDRADNCRSSFI
jgi:hypothetical protein